MGALDEPEIYQRALSGAEIDAIHDAGSDRPLRDHAVDPLVDRPRNRVPERDDHVRRHARDSRAARRSTRQALTISRTIDGGTPTSLPRVTTAADGTFSFQDTPGEGLRRVPRDVRRCDQRLDGERLRDRRSRQAGLDALRDSFGIEGQPGRRRHDPRPPGRRRHEPDGDDLGGARRGVEEAPQEGRGERERQPLRPPPTHSRDRVLRDLRGRRGVGARYLPTEDGARRASVDRQTFLGGYATVGGVRLYHFSSTLRAEQRDGMPSREVHPPTPAPSSSPSSSRAAIATERHVRP